MKITEKPINRDYLTENTLNNRCMSSKDVTSGASGMRRGPGGAIDRGSWASGELAGGLPRQLEPGQPAFRPDVNSSRYLAEFSSQCV